MHKPAKIFLRVASISFLFIAGISNAVLAQGPKKDSLQKPATPINTHINNNDETGSFTLQPIVRVGIGMLSYIGNVKSGSGTSNIQDPSEGRVGYDLGLAQPISPVTEVSLNFLYGNLSEVEQIPNAFWNFQSTVAGGGINVMFKILPKQQVTPYVIVGFESYEFISRADIYNQNGIQYYGWSDGTVRSLPQTSPYASTAQTLNITYAYQTDIRTLNIDGSGTGYNQQTFAVPLGVGFLFHLNPKADFMLGTTLHYTFTDRIDGLTPQVQGPLHGTLSNDMFAFTYASFRFNLTRVHAKRTRQFDEGSMDPSLLQDTVHPDKPGEFDTSLAAIEMQYERYMDTTGKYGGIHQVDSFHWQDKNWIGVGPAPRASVTAANNTSSPGNNNSTPDNNNATANNNISPPENNTSPPENNNTTPPANNNTANNNTTSPANNNTVPENNNATANNTMPPANNNAVPENNNTTANNNVTPPVNAATSGAENSGNVIYKVQILASQHKLAEGINFAGISDKASVDAENGTYKYTTGNFTQYSDAQKYLAQLKAIGYTDAFIRATQNGKGVPVPEHQAQATANNNPNNTANNNATVPAAASVTIPAEAMSATKEGLVFKVQFGVFGVSPKQPFINMFNSYADNSIVKDDAGLNHYMAGNYNTLQSAMAGRDKAKAAGVKDVCIKAVYNGKIISMSEAMNLLKK